MIELDDRISDVLARDPALVDVLVSVSPAFERLRRPAIARVMTRLVTVAQAARVAKVDPSYLLDRLNEALGYHPSGASETTSDPEPALAPIPAWLLALEPARIIDLDVREDLRHGREPFGAIMKALAELGGDQVLRVRATFEPVPLYAVMAKRGLAHHTEQLGDDDWRVWFVRDARANGAPRAQRAPREAVFVEAGHTVTLDVRGLEPPEPMVLTLEALEALPPGATLVQINERVPRFLLPELVDRGFEYDAQRAGDGSVRVHIRHRRKEIE